MSGLGAKIKETAHNVKEKVAGHKVRALRRLFFTSVII